jgi:hypothetical protein
MRLKIRLTYLVAISLVALAVGCTHPDRKTFAESWKTAVEKRDARLAWTLLDSASRARIVAGLKRAQEKAKQSDDFRHLFSFVNAPADLNLSAEELAIALLGQQLSSKENEIIDDGKTALIHVESGRWVASVEPVGFFDPDGVPLSYMVRLPSGNSGVTPAPASSVPASSSLGSPGDPQVSNSHISYHPSWPGKTASEMSAENAKVAGILADRVGLRNNFREWLTRIMDNYYEALGRGLNDMSFEVDLSGAVTPILTFDAVGPRSVPARKPRLAFGPWPVSR